MAGRKKGSKNLKVQVNNGVVNSNGVFISHEEKKHLVSLVNSANRKAKRMREEQDRTEFFIAGKPTGLKYGEIPSFMQKENDFVLAKKSKSLNRFKSRKEVEKYIAGLERVVKKDYIERRVAEYKQNHVKALRNVFGEKGSELVETLEKMSMKDYLKMVQSDETMSINFIGSDEDDTEFAKMHGYQRDEQLNHIKNALKRIKGVK